MKDDGFQLTGPDCAPTPRCIDRKAHSATNLFPELNKQTIKKEKKNRYLITIYSIDQTLFNRTKPANSFLRLELLHRIHQWLGNRLINTIIWIQNEFDSLFFILNSEGSQQISSQCSKTGDLYHKILGWKLSLVVFYH